MDPPPVMTIDNIMDVIKDPQNLGSLYNDVALGEEPRPLEIIIHRPNGVLQTLSLPQPFPFSTVYDVKLAIWSKLEKSVQAIPEKQFLATRKLRVANKDSYEPLDYYWSRAGTTAKEILVDPFDAKRLKEKSVLFVDETGAQRILAYQSLQKVLFENILKNMKNKEIHLFFYDDIKSSLGVISEKTWNGMLRPYFPLLSYENENPSMEILSLRLKKYEQSQEFITRIQNLLSTTELIPISAAGVRLLKFVFLGKPSDSIPSVESIFYSASVTKSRPFMRFKPTKGVEVVKLHLLKDNTPDLADPKLFKQWSRERNPTPENDYLCAKIIIKPMVAQQAPIYMTLQVFENIESGSADATVLPPKGIRKLDLITDLDKFPEEFKKGLEGIPFANVEVSLKRASLIYGIHLPSDVKSYSKRIMKERLKIFSAFFQEIPPLPGDQPLAMLRYKCVDNFATEDRIFSFLTQLATRKLEQGEGLAATLVADVENEFQLDTEEAKRVIAKWFQSKGEFDIVNPENKEYAESNNSGIDIAIYAQHPWYKFHLYNVNSTTNLQRILTLLSVLFSASDLELRVSSAAVAKVVETETVLAKVEEKEDTAEKVDLDDGDIEEDGPDDMGLLGLAAEDFGEGDIQGDEESDHKSVAEFVREDTVEPKEELSTIKQLPKSAVPAPLQQKNDNDDESVNTTSAEEGVADFFLTKLKEADKRLFDYTKTHPSLKKYVSMCAANVTRQPAVVSREQFEEMRDVIYANDIDKLRVNFVVYPKTEEESAAKNVRGGAETFYFLRYGTTERKFNENYYTCAKCFCIRDNLIIVEEDFLGTSQRLFDGTVKPAGTKPPRTCPFCLGVEVRNRRNPASNETVILREIAPKTKDKYHTYVGFLKKTPHPEGFYLPCCFIKPSTVKFTDKYYDKQRAFGSDMRPGKGLTTLPEEVEGEEELSVAPTATKETAPQVSKVRYISVLAGVSTRYIVGSEKLPLEIDEKGPQVGLLPPMLDEYFTQGKEDLIDVKLRSATKQHQLKKKDDGGARGFLRLGVENRVRFKSDSFLAAIAPFYMKENAEEMKELILQSFQLQPSIYFQLNYGNFLLEFYDSTQERPSWSELQDWLEGEDTNKWAQILHVQNPASRTLDLHRFYISYRNFENWLFDDSQQKEYRQFASLLAQPNFLFRGNQENRPGITFIVLDITEDNKVKVRCPPYGFNPVLHANNDIAFLIHHYSGVWEPIVYVDTRNTYEPYSFFFQKANEAVWPDIVKQRVAEFMGENGCFTSGKYSFASQMIVNPKKLIPSSKLYMDMRRKNIALDGMLRDPYNHLAALVFKNPENDKDLIPVPCVDNGFIIPSSKIYLDWGDFITADPKDIENFYNQYIVKQYSMYGDYSMDELWYTPVKENKIAVRAIKLKNNVLVPLRYKKTFTKDEFEYKMVEKKGSELEWMINKIIVSDDDGEVEEEETKMSSKDVNDIFEHLRITFANWLSMRGGNSTIRKEMEDIIFDDDLKLYEKRRAMEVLLSKDVMSWLSDDEQLSDIFPSIQRVDCASIQSEDVCKAHGRCVWKVEEEKCLIHTPKEFEMPQTKDNSIRVDFKRLLLFRLIEELLRFAERRRELLENDVSYIGTIDRPIKQGDQYIIPKNTMVWYELLRGDWMRTTDEKPKYFEEMSQAKPKEEPVQIQEEEKLPIALETFLKPAEGIDPKLATFYLYRKPLNELLEAIGETGISAEKEKLSKEEIVELSNKTKFSIAQIDLRVEPPELLMAKVIKPNKEYFVLVLTETGPALFVRDPSTGDLPSFEQLPLKLAAAFQSVKPKIRPVLKALKKIKPRILTKSTLSRNQEEEE